MPKQFTPLFSELSTFQSTVSRISSSDRFERPIIITSADFRFIVADQLRRVGVDADIVLEPIRRDSGPAVAVATVLGLERSPDTIALVLASDHAIERTSDFHAACDTAVPLAERGYIVTFGVPPTEPATGYGYLKVGNRLHDSQVCKLDAFAEKPDRETAQAYIDEGYLWNSGNFLFRCDTMRAEITSFQPDMMRAAEDAVMLSTRDLDFLRLAEAAFSSAPKISIDYAVMEHTQRSAVLAVDFSWSDLGSWDAIWANAPRDLLGNAMSGPCQLHKVTNSLVHSDSSILTTLVDLKDIVVVVSTDAVLVAPRTATNTIKELVEKMKAAGRIEATEHRRQYRPWGFYEALNRGPRHQVKRIVVNPGQRLSLQRHLHRSEHWVVVSGTGEITIGDKVCMVHENESTYIPIGCIHRIENPGLIPLELIEVAVGSYLGENDIIRLDDAYNRSTAST